MSLIILRLSDLTFNRLAASVQWTTISKRYTHRSFIYVCHIKVIGYRSPIVRCGWDSMSGISACEWLVCHRHFAGPGAHIVKQISSPATLSFIQACQIGAYFFFPHHTVWYYEGGTQARSWLRHCATSRRVAGSIPDCVTGIFHWHNPSGRSMAPGVDSASNRNEYQEHIMMGKGGRYVGLTI